MNPELLKLYTALQPFFRERIKEWYVRSQLYCDWHEEYNDLPGGRILTGVCSVHPDCFLCQHLLIVPRTIDDSSPEDQKRSLWGMLKWAICLNNNGKDGSEVCVVKNEGRTEIWDGEVSFKADTPTLAILRALCAQEGVESGE